MDKQEAARRLGVAESEVVDIRDHAGWWEVRHHDQASHDENWRRVTPLDSETAAVDESGPELVDVPAEVAPAPSRRKSR
jgi:hypothetical protein